MTRPLGEVARPGLEAIRAGEMCRVPFEHRRGAQSADAASGRSPCEPLLGEAPSLRAVREQLPQIARVARTTLLVGPTGSGKDLAARMLHQMSARSDRPFVTVHCAALPESLVEAEMFGHCRGAFTGATQSRAGLVRTASQGTLFLDEIDSLPISAQAKLLRFLETGEFRAVGSDRVEFSAAWVIAATNQNLASCVHNATFRADLLYRLAVMRVDLPALRDRPGDIAYLAQHFLEHVGRGDKRFSPEAQAALAAHSWPGNVRELKHRVESAALLTEAPIISDAALGLNLDQRGRDQVSAITDADSGAEARALCDALALERELWTLLNQQGMTLSSAVTFCEQLMIQAALRAEGNNRTRAANRLGIHVRTIFKKLIPVG
jgi:DNA-binding NtrC family response regulator